jgi:hypothetical protein
MSSDAATQAIVEAALARYDAETSDVEDVEALWTLEESLHDACKAYRQRVPRHGKPAPARQQVEPTPETR